MITMYKKPKNGKLLTVKVDVSQVDEMKQQGFYRNYIEARLNKEMTQDEIDAEMDKASLAQIKAEHKRRQLRFKKKAKRKGAA